MFISVWKTFRFFSRCTENEQNNSSRWISFNCSTFESFERGVILQMKHFFFSLLIKTNMLWNLLNIVNSFAHLQSISYPCPRIILSKKGEILLSHNERFLFVQTFIQGIEPTQKILDQDDHLFVLSNFMQCQNYLISCGEKCERGVIHNDFHWNNTVFTQEQ